MSEQPNCKRCASTGWVCEVHSDTPWDTVDKSCPCGAPGVPCPDCNTVMLTDIPDIRATAWASAWRITSTTPMIERVAVSVRSAFTDAELNNPRVSFKELTDILARAAIEAMREPTEGMLAVLYEELFDDKWDGTQVPLVAPVFTALMSPDRPAFDDKEIEITPEMVSAGVDRLEGLIGCGGSTYVVEEVYRAMALVRPCPYGDQNANGMQVFF